MKLLIGGSPCTHWSIARKGRETQPEGMGVEPILINSARVSAQSRQRLYWMNIPGVEQPEDRGIVLRDVLESGVPFQEKTYTLKANYGGKGIIARQCVDSGHFPANGVAEPVSITADGKAHTLKAQYFKNGIANFVTNGGFGDSAVAEPMRIGTIESGTQTNHDSKPFRVYSTDGKAVTLQGEAGGYGAKTGLYAVPVDPAGFAGGGGCCLPYNFRCRRTNDGGNWGPRPRDL